MLVNYIKLETDKMLIIKYESIWICFGWFIIKENDFFPKYSKNIK